MNKVEVFDPPMCCSSGVCGPSVDPALARFSSDLHWLANQRIAVERHNLAQQPRAFGRAGIKSYAWIVNQSFAGDGFRDPVLVERGSREAPYIAEVRDRLATRFAVIPWKPDAPVGPELLRELAGDSLVFAGASKR